jgi:protein-disulfide isomerase
MKQVVLAILLMLLGVLETAAQSVQIEEVLRVLGQGAGKGPEAAPITIIEFSDFQCSYCRKFWKETLPRLEAEYVKPGKVRFVYRHLAILGEQSVSAGQAAECARDQGKFWEYHDKLFASQGPFTFAMGNLKHYAKELGLDTVAFSRCLDSGKYSQKVDAETRLGSNLGLRGTPSFFINERLLIGAQPYEAFQLLIEDELEKAKSAKGPSRR